MSDEQQPASEPELRWAPIEPKPSNAKRNWLIAGVAVAALMVVAVLLFFLIPRGDEPTPDASGTPTPTTSASPTASPTPTSKPTAEPTVPPVTEPPVVDPSIEAFRGQVSGWLGDAGTGLDIVAGSPGQDALPVIDTLQEDAQRLSDAQPPSSILEQWYSGVETYAESLTALRTAVSSGSGVADAVDVAHMALRTLNDTVGL